MTDLMQLVSRKSYFWPKNTVHTHVFWQEIYFSYKYRTKSGMKIPIAVSCRTKYDAKI